MKWQNGDRYEGDWIDGIRQGKGCYTSKSSGNKYDGEYNNDKKEGSGKYIWSNGDWYDGAWSGGLRHGQGVYVWKEKNENSEEIEEIGRYEGDWKDGIKSLALSSVSSSSCWAFLNLARLRAAISSASSI